MRSEAYNPEVLKVELLNKKLVTTKSWEVAWLIWKARQLSGNIVEIGCHLGETTKELALAFPGRKIIAVDNIGQCTMENFQKNEQPTKQTVCMFARGLPNVRLELGDSKTFCYDTALNISMVFIDGDHSYNGVKADTEKAMEYFHKANRLGCIIWHDYYPNHGVAVKAYLDQMDSVLGEFTVVHNTSLVFKDFFPK